MPKRTRAIKTTDERGNKSWSKSVRYKYRVETRYKKKTFLIVCEGQSEKWYFESFPVVTATIKAVPLGCSTITLVACAKAMADDEKYDEIWCVFDMDYKSGAKEFQDFDNAIKEASAAGFQCAYSNDAYELWYLLHYQYIDQEQLRTFFYEKLSKLWNMNYEKSGKSENFAKTMYKRLNDDKRASQENAIANAEKLYNLQIDKVHHLQNPVTKVYELVRHLNSELRP